MVLATRQLRQRPAHGCAAHGQSCSANTTTDATCCTATGGSAGGATDCSHRASHFPHSARSVADFGVHTTHQPATRKYAWLGGRPRSAAPAHAAGTHHHSNCVSRRKGDDTQRIAA